MNKDLAIEILKAMACCFIIGLTCSDCPLWDNKTHRCRPWSEEEVTEAVRALSRETKES